MWGRDTWSYNSLGSKRKSQWQKCWPEPCKLELLSYPPGIPIWYYILEKRELVPFLDTNKYQDETTFVWVFLEINQRDLIFKNLFCSYFYFTKSVLLLNGDLFFFFRPWNMTVFFFPTLIELCYFIFSLTLSLSSSWIKKILISKWFFIYVNVLICFNKYFLL